MSSAKVCSDNLIDEVFFRKVGLTHLDHFASMFIIEFPHLASVQVSFKNIVLLN